MYSIYIVPENCLIVVHVLVNKKEFQILDQRDGKNKGKVLSDFHSALLDSIKSESGSPLDFRTRRRASPEVYRTFGLDKKQVQKSDGRGIIVLGTKAFATLVFQKLVCIVGALMRFSTNTKSNKYIVHAFDFRK